MNPDLMYDDLAEDWDADLWCDQCESTVRHDFTREHGAVEAECMDCGNITDGIDLED